MWQDLKPAQEVPAATQPRIPRDALLNAIKAGGFKLRETAPPAVTGTGQAALEEQGPGSPLRARANGMDAIMQRAHEMRAAAYPASTISDTSRWED